ncbi:MAG TPA: chemotaxis protein CheX [Nocardioidaceae bacterium]|nr:chemotaxis protein CheX [Nocardioidaceae bacterium]
MTPAATAYELRSADLAAITSDVWAVFCDVDEEFPLLPTTEAPADGAEVVHASVGVSGAWNGQVILELTAVTAHAATAAMLGQQHVEPRDMTDAVGELVNMVGGNIKSLLPTPSTLGLPVVVRGRLLQAEVPDAAEIYRAELAWAAEPLRVSVWTSDHTPGTNQGRQQ